MKTRKDFVTNSSSSSFLITNNSDETMTSKDIAMALLSKKMQMGDLFLLLVSLSDMNVATTRMMVRLRTLFIADSVVGAAQNDMAMGMCLWIFWRVIIKEKP